MLRLFRFIISILALPLALGFWPMASRAAVASGSLIKASGPAVYYVSGDKRYVFPNEKIFLSWYADFSSVLTVSDGELANFMIGGNVTYKPGVKMIKIQSDPKVYAVAAGGRLRWVATEEAAKTLYGNDWNKKIDDLSDAFFLNYLSGNPVYTAADFNVAAERAVPAISNDLQARASGSGPTAGETFTAAKAGNWSDAAVWGGKKVTPNAKVVIPANMKVTLDVEDTGTLASLEVAGTLEFLKDKSHILAARAIDIKSTGTLTVGTAAEPWPAAHTATIRLTGSTEGSDGLRVDGTLDLHGAPAAVAWTRMTITTEKGATFVILDRQTDWPIGAEILLAPTSASAAEAEVRTIVSTEGSKVDFIEPLAHAHRVEDGMTAEVGLLSRNVSVVGVGAGQGSSVSVGSSGKARISDTVFSGLGRTGVLGRSPIAFDVPENGALSSIRKSVIRDSGNRCVSFRQAAGVLVEDSVALNITGHCFSLLDGTETSLILRRNLVVGLKKGSAATGDDLPAGFHLRHPGSMIEGNAVVASEGFGYWYDLPEEVVRLNGLKVRPREADLGSFVGNLARGAAKDGLRVDDFGPGKMNYAPATKAIFSGYRGELNGDKGFWMRGSNMEVSGATLTGNKVGGAFAAFGAVFKDSTVIGNPESASSTPAARVGFLFIDGPVTVANVSFRNFVPSANIRAAALGFLDFNEKPVDPLSGFRGITLSNARAWDALVPTKSGEKMSVVRDIDAGKAIAVSSPFLDSSCTPMERNVMSCPGAYAQILVSLRDIDGKAVAFSRADTGASVTVPFGPAFDGTYAYATVREGGNYRFDAINARNIGVDYYGTREPLTVRLKTSVEPTVKEGVSVWQKKEIGALAPGSWAYDGGDAVVMLNPGGSVNVSW